MLRNRIDLIILGWLLLFYLAISLHNLDVVPQVYEDEPWQASTGWKLATQGVFGSDMLAGFYGMERRYYGFMPLHPLLLAAIFRIAGVGLFQARFETVMLGLLALVLTYKLARRLFHNARIGLLAVLFLLGVRLTGVGPSTVSGILFLDMARIARYDMVVPVFGLASLHAYLSAREHEQKRWYVLAGMLAGLAGLGHLYGLFWLPVVLLLTLWDGYRSIDRCAECLRGSGVHAPGWREIVAATRTPVSFVLLGFVLPWLPYLAYVLGDIYDWRGQTSLYIGERRFDLFDPHWYLDNLLNEPLRYRPGLLSVGPLAGLVRVGLWTTVVALPASLGVLAWRGLRRADRSARVVVVPAIVFPLLFALLLHIKMMNYIVAFAPLWAIAVAWGGVTFWERLGRAHWRWLARPALVLLLLAILVEGTTRVAALEAAASTTTPYYRYIQQVRQYVPPGARVIGLHNYWFGLEDIDYRDFIVPVYWTSQNNKPAPLPFDEGLDRVRPDIVLLDARMRGYLLGPVDPDDQIPASFFRWFDRYDVRQLGRVEDPTYGLMEIYQVRY
jgi:hypothetical protein